MFTPNMTATASAMEAYLIRKSRVVAVHSVCDAAVSIEDKGHNVDQEDDPAPKGGAHGSVSGGAGLQAHPKLHVYGDWLAPLLLFLCLGRLVGACSSNPCESWFWSQHVLSSREEQIGALQIPLHKLLACVSQVSVTSIDAMYDAFMTPTDNTEYLQGIFMQLGWIRTTDHH